ncbi:MAG: CHAT domain-containing protein [Gammaproteobacteria bacterium]|nr:CHAT domain-containing protein [Gammaproteobacteria bacterium]
MNKFQAFFLGMGLWCLCAAALAQSAFDEGKTAFLQGQFHQAAQHWEKALEILKESKARPDSKSYIDTLKNLGVVYHALGRPVLSEDYLQKALASSEHDKSRLALIHSALSETFRVTDQMVKSREHIQQAVEAAEEHNANEPHILAAVFNQQGNRFFRDEIYDKALSAYHEAETQARHSGKRRKRLLAKILVNITQLRVEQTGELSLRENRKKAWQQAVAAVQVLPDGYEKAENLVHLSQLALAMQEEAGLKKETESVLKKLISFASPYPRLMSYGKAYLGRLYRRDNLEKAIESTREAVFIAQEKAKDLLYRWERQLGYLLAKKGDLKMARIVYTQAIDHLEALRSRLRTAHYYGKPVNYRDSAEAQTYLEAVDFLLRQADNSKNNRQEYLYQALDTMERFKRSEVEEYFQSKCTISKKEKIDLKENYRSAGKAAIVYPIVFPDRVELLLRLPDRPIMQRKMPIGYNELYKNIKSLVRTLDPRRPGSDKKTKKISKYFYDNLIGPLMPEINAAKETGHVDILIIVPDDIIRLIPFAGLYDGKRYLLEKIPLAMTTAVILTEFEERDWLTETPVLAGKLSVQVEKKFPPLRLAHVEVDGIPDKGYRTDVLGDSEFIEKKVKQKLDDKRYDVVHLATHGQVKPEYKESFILLYEKHLQLEAIENLMKTGDYQGKPVELLVLSACETSVGNAKAALGMAGLTVKAGARSTVAGLRRIGEQATCYLMRTFYRELRKPGASAAQALQTAQLKLLGNERETYWDECDSISRHAGDYRHPAYWSPFMLIGNWL